ncbi:MAG: LytR/AlgR family response regulator transcription factor [Bacillota bacterium]
MNAIIIEDEAAAAGRLKKMIESVDPSIKVNEVIDNVEDAITWLSNNSAPDLIFMDIKLSDGLCFDIFDEVGIDSPVIFTTAYDDFTLQAFKANGIEYLLKPIKQSELEAAISKFRKFNKHYANVNNSIINSLLQKENKYKSRFLVKTGQKFFVLPASEVSYFYVSNLSTYIMCVNGKKFFFDTSLDSLETVLDPSRFFRANRKCIVNIKAIDSLQTLLGGRLKVFLRPDINEDIIISRKRVQQFKEWLTA